MRVRYRVEHETRYEHPLAASTSQHVAWLTPRSLPHQAVYGHRLTIEPEPSALQRRLDYYGNEVHQFAILTPYTSMTVTSRCDVELSTDGRALQPAASPAWEQVRDSFAYRGRPGDPLLPSIVEFSYPTAFTPVSPEVEAFARGAFTPGRPLLESALDLMHRIHEGFTFDPAATSVATPLSQVLVSRRGVCQDFAHLQIAALRSLGLAARYVSGYLLTDPPPGQPRLIGADASHAWVSVWCPVHGWVDLDPTNDAVPALRHVTLAWGRDYGDVTPLRGVVLGGSAHRLSVAVSVIPLDELTLEPGPIPA